MPRPNSTNWPRSTSSAASIRPRRSRSPDQLMAKDALAAHARDELGISEITTARPVQAALTSAVDVSGRRRPAAADGRGLAGEPACPDRLGRVAGLSGAARRHRRQGGRRRCCARRRSA